MERRAIFDQIVVGPLRSSNQPQYRVISCTAWRVHTRCYTTYDPTSVARRARTSMRCARSARAADPLVRFRDDSFLISSQKTTRLSTGPVLRPLAWRACPRVNPYVSKLSHPLPQAPGRPPMYTYSPSSPSATKVCSTPRGGLARSMARSHRATIRIAISPSSDRDRSGLQFVHDPATPNETTPNETPLMWS